MRKRYENPDGPPVVRTFADLRRWRRERREKVKDLSYRVPNVEPNVEWLRGNRSECSVTAVGHATFLIQTGGLNVITDPVWAERMGFERRLSPPGLKLDEIPPIDVVLISHGHYDHLHLGSLRRLPGDFTAFVPEGLGRWFRRRGFRRVREFSWWEEASVENVSFAFVPAKHWTRRTPWDTNTSHWGGWVISGGNSRLYFAGDSGYWSGFAEIGERFPGIDLALLPIGAYEPEWFMSESHMSPEEAVRVFADVGARTFVPMHYDTFRLADDTPREALQRLEAEWKRRGLAKDKLWVLPLGETRLWYSPDITIM
ncbi:MBL fold metallo-hydrolase [Paenibacillus alkalitolerans]|uniref:MBL fold metallo-hydrolase n=1 Tax=Paenibacillus alkalitolerans TaxID=2799335 RepID=UPI0018F5CA5A|nr:MBL fold metallo-hydrolase [Paenibacillus alkalitolerans]